MRGRAGEASEEPEPETDSNRGPADQAPAYLYSTLARNTRSNSVMTRFVIVKVAVK